MLLMLDSSLSVEFSCGSLADIRWMDVDLLLRKVQVQLMSSQLVVLSDDLGGFHVPIQTTSTQCCVVLIFESCLSSFSCLPEIVLIGASSTLLPLLLRDV